MFNVLLKGATPFLIGQVAYVIAFVLFYFSFKFFGSKFGSVVTSMLTVAVMVVVMTLFNFFIITPIYALAYGGAIEKGLIFTFPTSYTDPGYILFVLSIYPLFNFIQWGVNTLIISGIKK
jgi:riboflavin transporter FmnP